MSNWEQAVRKLFQSHPRSISAKTVIEAINSQAPETFTLSARDLCVTDDTQTKMSPIAHTADLVTRSRYRAEGRIAEREAITATLKALPHDALFYPDNILKILKLD